MGPKSFEQCAGFLKIPESADPLDNTWVHPENYGAARLIRQSIGAPSPEAETGAVTLTGNLGSAELTILKEEYGVGETTINDILEELKKPNRDPREGYPKPLMQKGVLSFEDLREGMAVTGKIKNVVDFGAFVDLGIKETALVHISELSDHFVKDPMDLVKVGDVLEFRILALDPDRRRISLTRKSAPAPAPAPDGGSFRGGAAGASGGAGGPPKKPVLAVRKADSPRPAASSGSSAPAASPARNGPAGPARPERPRRDDDGTMYNPFAEALKKMREKTPGR
jgi:uncharacterized protein